MQGVLFCFWVECVFSPVVRRTPPPLHSLPALTPRPLTQGLLEADTGSSVHEASPPPASGAPSAPFATPGLSATPLPAGGVVAAHLTPAPTRTVRSINRTGVTGGGLVFAS